MMGRRWWVVGVVAAPILLVGVSWLFVVVLLRSPLWLPRPVPEVAASAMLTRAASDLGTDTESVRVIRGVVYRECVTSTFLVGAGESKTVAVLKDGSWDVRLTSLTVDRDALPSAEACRRLWESSAPFH